MKCIFIFLCICHFSSPVILRDEGTVLTPSPVTVFSSCSSPAPPPSAQQGPGLLHLHCPPQWNHLQAPGKAARPDSKALSALRKSANPLSLIHRNLHHLTGNMLCAILLQNLHHHTTPPRKTQAHRTK